MRNPDRIPIILKRLEIIWSKHSGLRLGQIFVNLYSSLEQKRVSMFSIEDDELLTELEKFFDNNKTK